MKPCGLRVVLSLLALAACKTSAARQPAAVSPVASHPGTALDAPHDEPAVGAADASASTLAAVSAPAPTAATLGKPTEQFLVAVHGVLLLRSVASEEARVLLPHVEGLLYDPALELVWFTADEHLGVLDLRTLGAPPAMIARGMPETTNRLSISRPHELVETEDQCDLPFISLEWSERPTIKAFLTSESSAPAPRIDNFAWLKAQLLRPARTIGKRQEFGDKRVRLPKRLLDCEEKADCGATVAFGKRDYELVKVQDKMGGDCWNRACLLHDARTGSYASPPQAASWGPVEQAVKGPCGLFMFDQAQTSFLLGHTLCVSGRPCVDLEGHAVGWLVPGDIVGSP
ncbi:MAG: hypothetical protein JWN04_850 [Myxococcaceae bacterium]|nr:hypothetical protein [Myxococcaceae bacterium]